jgi:hypothetical protein
MQSTGVYWIPLYEILDARGLEVYLVNARHTKNLPGRKSDVQESQWLMKLHRYGLLRNSFHPATEIRVIRTYWRQRGDQVRAISTCVQRMQKTLTQMNIQLANVISDLSGWTGMRIVRAILTGERDPQALAALSHPGIRATRDVMPKASKEPGSLIWSSFSNKKSRCTTPTNNGSLNAIRHSKAISKASLTGAPTRSRQPKRFPPLLARH